MNETIYLQKIVLTILKTVRCINLTVFNFVFHLGSNEEAPYQYFRNTKGIVKHARFINLRDVNSRRAAEAQIFIKVPW